jgi:copper(I)-binding protein
MKLKTLTALLAFSASAAFAQVEVKDAWVRATVPGQKATGAFMKLTAKEGTKLVSASTSAAGITEVHEMKMEGDVMKMRAIPGLELPAGKTVELKPGGFHVMLMDLKAPLAKDSMVNLTLTFKNSKGVESKQEVKLPVNMGATSAASKPAAAGAHDHMKH